MFRFDFSRFCSTLTVLFSIRIKEGSDYADFAIVTAGKRFLRPYFRWKLKSQIIWL